MQLVFSRQFYGLLIIGLVPLSLSWSLTFLRSVVFAFDALLIAAAFVDYFISRRRIDALIVMRVFDKRFAIGDRSAVRILIENPSPRSFRLQIKDEYPPEMRLDDDRHAEFALGPYSDAQFTYSLSPPRRGHYEFGRTAVRFLSRLRLVWCQALVGQPEAVKVYPNMRRAREIELKALGAQSFLAIQRRAVRRGEGREFESMRDYVRGDELRHISWTATARRSKLTTRQYQIERDQTVIVAVDGGRLMTGIIGGETKFDTAIHASLALMSACARAGDNAGLLVFGRREKVFAAKARARTHGCRS